MSIFIFVPHQTYPFLWCMFWSLTTLPTLLHMPNVELYGWVFFTFVWPLTTPSSWGLLSHDVPILDLKYLIFSYSLNIFQIVLDNNNFGILFCSIKQLPLHIHTNVVVNQIDYLWSCELEIRLILWLFGSLNISKVFMLPSAY